ncbi:MAG: hypothetical protein ABIO29_06025 [Sphingomicrobium sp.]
MASKRVKNPESLDAIDIALARVVDSDTAKALLEKQARLIDSQETLARADLRHRGWQIIGERVGALIKALTVTVGVLLLAGIIIFFWTAHKASGMVMDPFSVPPTMDRQGLTGSVVAQQLLDKIAALESGTESVRASSSYENSWGDSKGVAVPYAGVSLGELRREARAWLGSEKHLSGDVVQLPGGRIAISFRTLNASGRVEGLERDYDALLQQVALQVFKATQPYRYAVYAGRTGNAEERRAVLLALSRSDNSRERPWALHGLALNEPTNDRTEAVYQRLLAIDPYFVPAVGNMWIYAGARGQEEEAFSKLKRSIKAYETGADDFVPDYGKGFALDTGATLAGYFLGDQAKAAELSRKAEEHRAGPVNSAARPYATAQFRASAHDYAGAREALASARLSPLVQRPDYQKVIGPQYDEAALRAFATGDQPAIVAAVNTLIARFRADSGKDGTVNERFSADTSVRALLPDLALALARSGKLAEARAAIAALKNDDDRALRIRAFIAALAHDPAADRLFAASAASTPSLPLSQMLWAEARVRTGDPAGALDHAAAAAELGPNAADNFYWWGKALLALHRPDEASAKFAEAARRTPHWGSLHMDWAEALWQSGDRGKAVDTLRSAAMMALSSADQARWRRMAVGANRFAARAQR